MLKRHEHMRMVSELVSDQIESLAQRGLDPNGEKARAIAAHTIIRLLPDLYGLTDTRMILEATSGLGDEVEHEEVDPIGDIHVNGIFKTVTLQTITEHAAIEDVVFEHSRYELCAIMTPVFVEADPPDILLHNRIYVPFSGLMLFDVA